MRLFNMNNSDEVVAMDAINLPQHVGSTYRSNIIEDAHYMQHFSGDFNDGGVHQRHRNSSSSKKYKPHKATNTAAFMYQSYETSSSSTATTAAAGVEAAKKSRSLERYSQPPHAVLAATIDIMPHPATLTPTLNARRRFLSPFKSMKRRSRSSSSSGGESKDITNIIIQQPIISHTIQYKIEKQQQQQLQEQLQKMQSQSGSQSGDSGTGGTELTVTENCSRTSAAESSQLSLSYSQLSSSVCGSGSSSSLEAVKVVSAVGEHVLADVIVICAQPVLDEGEEQEEEEEEDDDEESENNNRIEEREDDTYSEEHSYCGNITLVDDTYSNYDPQNDAERMFLQVVGILRNEKEV